MSKIPLRDRSILGPIAFLGPDLTAAEWAEKLQVPLDEVLNAFEILQLKPKRITVEPRFGLLKQADQAAEILSSIRAGKHRIRDISIAVGLHTSTVRRKLDLLVRQGVVHRVGKGPNRRWVSA